MGVFLLNNKLGSGEGAAVLVCVGECMLSGAGPNMIIGVGVDFGMVAEVDGEGSVSLRLFRLS